MNTYFARHTADIDIDDATRRKLWDEQWVAIHYPEDRKGVYPEQPGNLNDQRDNVSLNTKDYTKRAAAPLSRLVELSSQGGYVCADYSGQSESVLGYVEPGTPIDLIEGKRGKLKGVAGRQTYLKGIRLTKTRVVSTREYAQIFVGRPRQGTLSRWRCIGNLIENLVERQPVVSGVEALFPHQLEILCSEFLRTEEAARLGLPKLETLVLPVGRALKGIDIFGVTSNGERIYAQVTHPTIAINKSKYKQFRHFAAAKNSRLVYFCSADGVICEGGVHICPIQLVYDYFKSTAVGQRWLEIAVSHKGLEQPISSFPSP